MPLFLFPSFLYFLKINRMVLCKAVFILELHFAETQECRESNEQLVARIKAGEDVTENMEKLYMQVRAFIGIMAWKYRGSAEPEDLAQEGFLALYSAIENYNPAAGCLFLTYAGSWIRQAMRKYIQNNSCSIKIPEHKREQILRYRKLERVFLCRMGREPSEQEALYYLGFTRQQAQTIRGIMDAAKVQSLEECLPGDGENTLGDITPGPENVEKNVLDEMELQRLRAVLWREVDSLPGEQPRVLRSLYQEGQTLKQTGDAMGTTLERVRGIKANVLRELRKPRHSRKLCVFLPEIVESQAYRHNGVGEFDRTWTSSTEWAALKLLKENGTIV